MKSICFVILHYMDFKITEGCVDSILKNIKYENMHIVVVDNGSPNDSGSKLQEKYKDNEKIVVISLLENKGFANGNNIGYTYACEKLHADFIIVANNDTLFSNNNFVDKMLCVFEKNQCYLMGPDIVTPTGIHQNPHRKRILTKADVYKALFIKTTFYFYFKIKKVFHIDDKIMLLENWYDLKNSKNQDKKSYNIPNYNGVLQGACIIYTPLFVRKEKKAFCSETFMYGEEDILAYYCSVNGYLTLYTPEIQVLHFNGETTGKVYKASLDKQIFSYRHYIKGLKILLKKMKIKSKVL